MATATANAKPKQREHTHATMSRADVLKSLSAAAPTSARLAALDAVGVQNADLVALLDDKVQAQTVRLWRKGSHEPRDPAHLALIDDLRVVVQLAVRLTGDFAIIERWLRSRNKALGYRRPIDVAAFDVMAPIEVLEWHRLSGCDLLVEEQDDAELPPVVSRLVTKAA